MENEKTAETENETQNENEGLIEKTPKKAKPLPPKLMACKVEMNTVEMPVALRQRNIQIQALESSRKSAEVMTPLKVTTVENELKHRKKAVILDDPLQSSSAGNTDDGGFETDLIIEFSPEIQKKTLHWIIDKIRTKTSRGGAGLLIRREPQTNPHKGLIIHVSAENYKFLQIADELELMKPTRSGVMKNFNISCLDDFFIDDSMVIDNVLTLGERQMLIKHAVDCIKANEMEKCIPGYEHVLLYHGQSLIQACIEEELVLNVFSLRDTEYLKKLKPWYCKWSHWQPLDRIRDYFGESIGIYFAFVEYHTIALIVPVILGVFQYFFFFFFFFFF